MKNILLLASLLLSAAGAAFAQNSSLETEALVLPPNSGASVAKGMTREAVTLLIGLPGETLGANVWVYWDFKGHGVAKNFDTLVLVFIDGEVSAMRLCDRQVVRTLIAKQKVKPATKTASAK